MVRMDKKNKDLFPLPMPTMVKEGFKVTALCAIVFFFPVFGLTYVYGLKFLAWFMNISPHQVEPEWILLPSFGISIMTVTIPPFWITGIRTSAYLLNCIRWHLDHDNEEAAKVLAMTYSHAVMFSSWKKNNWFRAFVLDNGLDLQNARYARFSRRIGQ